MSELWMPVDEALAKKAGVIAAVALAHVDSLDRAAIEHLDPLSARALLDQLSDDVTSGWAYVSRAKSAQIFHGQPRGWGNGGVLAAELCLKGEVAMHLTQAADGQLRLVAFGADLGGFLSARQGQDWIRMEPLKGLLCEKRSFLQLRAAGLLHYRVYWQVARDFGLRERLAVFEGMSSGGV